ncbi:hypothetical protein ACVW16_002997 [Bradyrhizobium sp. USDA 4474]
MLGQRLRRLRLAMALEIVRRCHRDPPHLADVARDQGGVGEVADPYRGVDSVFHEVDEVIRQPEFAGNAGITLQIGGHDRTDMQPAEADRGRHHQAPARPVALLPRGAVGFLDIGEDPPDALQIARPDVGQSHLPRGPLQQPCAEMLFKRGDQSRHRGGRQPQFSRCRREATQVGDGDEDVHGFQPVHAHYCI